MARGIGKNIVAAAKLLSNPVAAVASVFRKKKTLRRGRTAASAGLVRRKYKGRASARPKLSNDGNGNIKMAKRIGRQPRRLNKSLEAKIRDVLNPANHHVIQQTGNVNISNGKCTYTHFEMMNAEDIDEVIAQAGNSGIATAYSNAKLNIQNAHLQLSLRNQTTNLVYLTVYEYICRRSVPDKMETVPGSGVEVDGNTKDAIEYGFNYQQVHQIDYNTLGGTLFQNPFFCTYYKITKVRKVMLGAGKCLALSLSNLKPRVINPLIYNNTDGDVEAGLTRGFVIQASGSLVGSEGHSSVATTGFVNFDWFCSRKYAWNQPYWAQGKNTYASNVPQPEAPMYHINEYTGSPQIQAEA